MLEVEGWISMDRVHERDKCLDPLGGRAVLEKCFWGVRIKLDQSVGETYQCRFLDLKSEKAISRSLVLSLARTWLLDWHPLTGENASGTALCSGPE